MSACAGTPVAEAVPAGHTQWCDDGTRRVYFERRGSEGPAFPSTTPRALRKQRKRLPERGIISGATMTPPSTNAPPRARSTVGSRPGPALDRRAGRSGRGRVARRAAAHTFRYSTSQQGAWAAGPLGPCSRLWALPTGPHARRGAPRLSSFREPDEPVAKSKMMHIDIARRVV